MLCFLKWLTPVSCALTEKYGFHIVLDLHLCPITSYRQLLKHEELCKGNTMLVYVFST